VLEGNPDHGLVPVWPAVVFATPDQPLDLSGLGEVFPCSDIGIFRPVRRDFPYFGGWWYDSRGWFCHCFLAFRSVTFGKVTKKRKVGARSTMRRPSSSLNYSGDILARMRSAALTDPA
jgi:hypothetical protein